VGAIKVLVTGGAVFIGSHTVLALQEAGHQTVVVDNLGNGHRDAMLDAMVAGEFHALDIRDTSELAAIIARSGVEAVVHFAAFIEAGVSVREPLRFLDNVEPFLILNGVLVTATDVDYVSPANSGAAET
jgi:UDP-glucose 4-epimerase